MQVLETPKQAGSSIHAITAFLEYQGTHFLSASLDGVIHVWAFMAQPGLNRVVEVQPIAQYTPAQGVPGSVDAPLQGVLSCAICAGPEGPPGGSGVQSAFAEWLLVGRISGDSLECLRMGPAFEWGGTLAKTTRCRAILPLSVQRPDGEEHLLLAGSGHIVKVFRWRTGFD
jgi:hypothetical protein